MHLKVGRFTLLHHVSLVNPLNICVDVVQSWGDLVVLQSHDVGQTAWAMRSWMAYFLDCRKLLWRFILIVISDPHKETTLFPQTTANFLLWHFFLLLLFGLLVIILHAHVEVIRIFIIEAIQERRLLRFRRLLDLFNLGRFWLLEKCGDISEVIIIVEI